ncbi:hypothetical protein N7462_007098 [Penicillium macrosclerotiorum]|uniref:uncharacterized protein n=1 Tax=Penicillium macrosclerotiorum TaxID=303699 RepID=UPI002549BC95|nr:uncharacterized protein N7462_007098 [Penicillium macrosclerotiorum]KAJ5678854.1 hypothetical protein N7462_007098 [Penicillium macrosclerotiorum]
MAARLSRTLLQANRRLFAGSSFGAIRRSVPRRAPWTSRVIRANVARYAHTDSGSPATVNASILDATGFKGTSDTKKHWTNQDLPIVDALFEPLFVPHFLEFISSGILPNRKETDLSLLTPDELQLFTAPRAHWAPAPFNQDAPPAIENIMQQILNPEISNGLCQLGQNIHFVKRRLSEGLAPVSASRWQEKDLNNPDHFAVAHEYLTSVLAVFEYLNFPQNRVKMRDTFNNVSKELQIMQDALNARRKAQSNLSPKLELTALWEEYIRARYEIMTSTAHSWVIARAAELRERTLDGLSALGPDKMDGPEMNTFSQQWTDLISVVCKADLQIWITMDGYNDYHPPSEIVGGLYNPDLEKLQTNYGLNEALMDRLTKCIQAQNEAQKIQGPSATQSEAARRERMSISTVVQDELREKIRGRSSAPQQSVQPWIQLLLHTHEAISQMPPSESEKYGFGLAIYCTAHKLSGEQLQSLKQKVEADFSAWGDDVQLADKLKPLLKLHWFDGKELGFDPANTVEAARRHYQQIRSSDEWSRKVPPSTFLLIDPKSADSYINETTPSFQKDKAMLPGDFRNDVIAIDANFDRSAAANESADGNAAEIAQYQDPDYHGHMRILGNLVWSELYPLVVVNAAELSYLWPQAKQHPGNVYTGPTVPSQVEPWKEVNDLQGMMMSSFMDFLKKKDSTLAGKLEDLKKNGSFPILGKR